MAISYRYSAEGIKPQQLEGFFEGWPSPPAPETHLRVLRESDEVVLAWDDKACRVVGFITAITDHVLAAYIPFLEVLPAYRHQGIGRELVRRVLERLHRLYMVDLICDPELQPFYETLGMQRTTGMMVRHREHQAGGTHQLLQVHSLL
jgi:ribosomal protein S18 acetylase RimI-like enzyme